jgi:hypothetical protein
MYVSAVRRAVWRLSADVGCVGFFKYESSAVELFVPVLKQLQSASRCGLYISLGNHVSVQPRALSM